MTLYKSDDINLLLPSFRERVKWVMSEMKDIHGHGPVLKDGLRTTVEALQNSKKGSGIVDSMHCYGCAADIICGQHGWSCAMHDCRFYFLLGEVAEAYGLVWGGRWVRKDMPHVQGIPVRWQDRMRVLGMAKARVRERNALCELWFAQQPKPKAAG